MERLERSATKNNVNLQNLQCITDYHNYTYQHFNVSVQFTEQLLVFIA